MKTRIAYVLLMMTGAGLLGTTGGCEMSGHAEAYNSNIEAHPIDKLNRNLTESQSGAVAESPSLAPPVRKEFVSDR